MASSDVFALNKSGLNAFLFAEVGMELNGSSLTVLSLMARLEKDPWAEAARWAKLPKAVATDYLAQAIAKMPLNAQALADASATAARLILLLPAREPVSSPVKDILAHPLKPLKWRTLVMCFAALAISLAVQFCLR